MHEIHFLVQMPMEEAVRLLFKEALRGLLKKKVFELPETAPSCEGAAVTQSSLRITD